MLKLRFLAFSILVTLAGCGGSNEPGPDLGTGSLACMHAGDCGSGKDCCVTYSSNNGGYATSQCVPSGMCRFFNFIEGGTGTICDSDSDCQQAGLDGDVDAGTHKLVCGGLVGVSIGMCSVE